MGDVFAKWNKGVLDSFLIEITRDIMYKNDDKDGVPIVEKILDSAGQKGTGKWTAINALDLGMPVTLIGEAVFARCLSSLKAERGRASGLLQGPTPSFSGDREQFLANLEQALYASKIISYAQGFMLIQNVCEGHMAVDMLTALGGERVQLEAEQAGDCSHVARRLHHSIRVSQGHYQGVGVPGLCLSWFDARAATARIRSSRTCCSTTSSTKPSTRHRPDGESRCPA